MSEIDPVVLRFMAETGKFQADLRNTTRTVDQQLGTQERRVKKLEAEFRRSSTAISTSLKGLAGTLATAFTGRELVRLIDSYTQLQNSLRVAGLEGENLAQVQTRLVDLATRNGVAVNALADLYGKTSQAGQELGATQDQLLRLTENTALALRISGTNAQAAAGAILGLTQALSSSVVRAEEFNQINEGGLRPLLQAAAASDRFGGSVAKLRQAVVEGKLSSEELFRAILQGSERLREQAGKSVLTVSGAFESLNTKLIEYVGSNASATGATALLSGAIEKLANNIGTVIEALAVIAVAFTARFAAGAAAAATSAIGLRVVALGLAAQLNGTAAAATLAGRSLLAAFGGPVGLAVGALTLGFIALQAQTRGAEAATGEYRRTLDDARKVSDAAREAADRLANAHGNAREEALKAAESQRELTKQNLATARSSLIAAQAELEKARAFQKAQNIASIGATGVPGTGAFIQGSGDARLARASSNEAAAREAIKTSEESLRLIESAINAAAPPSVATGGTTPTGSTRASGGAAGAGRGARDVAAIELRFRDELDSIRSRIAAAEAVRATTAEERAEFERRQLELAEAVSLRSLDADQDLTEAQKAIVRERLLALGEAERDAIAFRERAEQERRALELADERGRAQIDALRLQFDLADTDRDRRAIALRILEVENALIRSRLEGVIASDTANDIEKKRAEIALAALKAQEAAQAEVVSRQFEGPLKRFSRNAQDSDQRVEEAAVRRIEQLNQTITDAMTNALGIEDPFLRDLISIFLDKNIFGPLAEALGGAGGSGGGLGSVIGSLIGSIFGRSSGGRVTAGRPFRVNEGAPIGRVEGFIPDQSGTIIPLGRMNALAQGGAAPGAAGEVRVVIEEAPGFAARVQAEAVGVAVEVVRQSAPDLVDAAANETFRRAGRPSL